MTDSFKYDVSLSPDPIPISITLEASKPKKDTSGKPDPTHFVVTVTSVPDVTLTLTPAGSWIQKILSGVIYPIAAIIAATLKGAVKGALEGKTFTPAGSHTFKKDGFEITPQLGTLGGATINGKDMVKITGTLDLNAGNL